MINWITGTWMSFIYNVLGINRIYHYVDKRIESIHSIAQSQKDYMQEHSVAMQEQRELNRSMELRNIEQHELYKRAVIALDKFHKN